VKLRRSAVKPSRRAARTHSNTSLLSIERFVLWKSQPMKVFLADRQLSCVEITLPQENACVSNAHSNRKAGFVYGFFFKTSVLGALSRFSLSPSKFALPASVFDLAGIIQRPLFTNQRDTRSKFPLSAQSRLSEQVDTRTGRRACARNP
jgi:hypothetical protein